MPVIVLLITSVVLLSVGGCGEPRAVSSVTAPAESIRPEFRPPSELAPVPAANLNDGPPPIVVWQTIDDLPQDVAVFRHVFWEPDDTVSLRKLIRETDLVRGKRVLEIGTGSGLIALCCLQAGASRVVATDINPFAMRNAAFNAERMNFTERIDIRLVPQRDPAAWSVLGEHERFDLIISNPPWEDDKPTTLADFALYDPDFQLMDSLLDGVNDRLNPGGKVLLAYGCVTAIRRLQQQAADRSLSVRMRDDRSLDELDEVFLPGMLLEVSRQP